MEVTQVRLGHLPSAPAHTFLPEKEGVSQEKSHDTELAAKYEP